MGINCNELFKINVVHLFVVYVYFFLGSVTVARDSKNSDYLTNKNSYGTLGVRLQLALGRLDIKKRLIFLK